MAIVNAQLTTNQLTVLQVPENKTYAVTNILVCHNGDTAAPDPDAAFDLHLVQNSSGNPGVVSNAVTRVVNNLVLPAGETFTFDSERIILETGDRIVFVAEQTGVVSGNTDLAATVSYLEV